VSDRSRRPNIFEYENTLRYLISATALAAVLPSVLSADEEKPAPKDPKKEMRVIVSPDHDGARAGIRIDHRGLLGRDGEGEKETVTFLGVETSPVSSTLTAQLGLPDGSGLVVAHLASDGPAVGMLKEHDILLKLDDQLLVEQRQLAVLIRNHKEGDEVTLTYLRGGKQATAKIKLGKHEVLKMSLMLERTAPGMNGFYFGSGFGGATFERLFPGPDGPTGREETDRVLGLIQRGRGAPDAPNGAIPPPARIEIDRRGAPGFRAMSINTGNSNIVFSDDAGSLDLTMKEGKKTLVAKNPAGEQLFSGPVTTPEERKALPEGVRERLEKLEGMHEMSFHTDNDFEGAETKVVRPSNRGIALPAHPGIAPRPTPFF